MSASDFSGGMEQFAEVMSAISERFAGPIEVQSAQVEAGIIRDYLEATQRAQDLGLVEVAEFCRRAVTDFVAGVKQRRDARDAELVRAVAAEQARMQALQEQQEAILREVEGKT